MDIKEPNNNGFTIYSKSGCPFCLNIKNLFQNRSNRIIKVYK